MNQNNQISLSRKTGRAKSGHANPVIETRPKHCAIYTRKSTEEGLDQDFNSLDNQWEACEAFIRSQQHEGWVLIPEHYDDGGFSGGNIERPALKRIWEDVNTGKVDIVVVHRIDRLTRSLLDFGVIVQILESAGASFVSVTQQYIKNSFGIWTHHHGSSQGNFPGVWRADIRLGLFPCLGNVGAEFPIGRHSLFIPAKLAT